MLKIGLIGNIGSLIPYVHQLEAIPEIKIVGKSSIGLKDQPAGVYLSTPEFDRNELIDSVDALIIDKSSLLPNQLFKECVKKSKHLYITDFPDISPDFCNDLLKLSDEAKTIVQIGNPLLPGHISAWLNENFQEPVYISVFDEMHALPDKRNFLLSILVYAHALFNKQPQKIRISGIHQAETNFYFINLHLDYPTYSTLNIELLVRENEGREIKVILPGKFLKADLRKGIIQLNHEVIKQQNCIENDLSLFIKNIKTDNLQTPTGLNTYRSALLTLEEVNKKIALYTSWL